MCRLLFLFLTCCAVTAVQAQEVYRYGPEDKQDYDLYPSLKPATDTCILFVHAGGWGAGDKNNFGLGPAYAAGAGLWSVSMNYRLIKSGHNYLDNLEDVRLCIDSVQARTGCSKFILLGGSAGATIAMNYACQAGDPRVIFVVGFAGAYDFSKSNMTPKVYENGLVYCNHDVVNGSPITFAANCPPTLLVHGYLDETIYCKQAFDMYRKMRSLHKDVQGHLLTKTGHRINADQIPMLVVKIIERIRLH